MNVALSPISQSTNNQPNLVIPASVVISAATLAALATANGALSPGAFIQFVNFVDLPPQPVAQMWTLLAGTNTTTAGVSQNPNDYDPVLNAVYWVLS